MGERNQCGRESCKLRLKEGLRKDLSQLEASKDKDISNFRHWERLERKQH